jgi:hypothetical protein
MDCCECKRLGPGFPYIVHVVHEADFRRKDIQETILIALVKTL